MVMVFLDASRRSSFSAIASLQNADIEMATSSGAAVPGGVVGRRLGVGDGELISSHLFLGDSRY